MIVNPGSMLHGSRALINMQFRMILINKYNLKLKKKFNLRLKASSYKLQAASLNKNTIK